MNSESSVNPKVIIGIQKQINELMKKAPDCVKYIYNETDVTDIQADIYGPIGTPYQGGVFRCKLVIGSEFPKVPPKGYLMTKIFHPNISEKGEICVNTLKKDWDPRNWSLYGIFEVIKCLLIVPFPESALNEDAAKLFMENYEEYFKHAKLLTELHSFPKGQNTFNKTSSPVKSQLSFETKSMDISPLKSNSNSNQVGETQLIKENVNEVQSFGFGGALKIEKANSLPVVQNSGGINFYNSNSMNSNYSFNSMGGDKNPDDVLMTVTNSLNTNSNSSNNFAMAFKKQNSFTTNNAPSFMSGNVNSNGSGMNVSTPTSQTNGTNTSAKKENEKKIWMKRI